MIVNSIYTPDGWGGAERSTQVLAENLVKSGYEVLVVCTARKNSREKVNDVHVERLANLNIAFLEDLSELNLLQKILWHLIDIFNVKSIYKFSHLINKFDPDVIHTNNLTGFSCSVWLSAKINRIPIIHTLRDYYLISLGSANTKRPLINFLFKYHNRIMTNLVDCAVGNSKFILDSHISNGLFKKSKSDVIFNAFSPKGKIVKKKCTKKYLFLGKLSHEKGVDILCKAFFELCEEGYDISLYVAGVGQESFSKKLISRYNSKQIKFIGYVDPDYAYNLCSWVVVPSIWDEPLSRTCFEPLFHSIPVITSDAGGNKEAIINNFNGLVFLRNNIEDLKIKIKKSLSVDYQKFSKNAAVQSKKFSVNNLLSKYIKIYEEF